MWRAKRCNWLLHRKGLAYQAWAVIIYYIAKEFWPLLSSLSFSEIAALISNDPRRYKFGIKEYER
jgi:hypothetical protein